MQYTHYTLWPAGYQGSVSSCILNATGIPDQPIFKVVQAIEASLLCVCVCVRFSSLAVWHMKTCVVQVSTESNERKDSM